MSVAKAQASKKVGAVHQQMPNAKTKPMANDMGKVAQVAGGSVYGRKGSK